MSGMIRYTATALALTLAACSNAEPEKAPAEVPEQPVTAEPVAPPPAAPSPPSIGPTTGGDGSEIILTPLTGAEIEEADLQGELGCSFATAGAAPLLIAMGNVASKEPAFGLIKIGDYVERVAAPGGFDGMLKGATFSGRGTTIRIALTGPATGGGESPPSPATLTFDRMDGAQRVFAGRWSCGP
ncbi:hypothetical protein ACFOMD_14440 [Sphingoaurantiacus capsulatus]|uniref:Lipoprotein n=1 Tax=Sphingoaurantiacus capsulatus TaxID=1771310 RepID=A0ABV7XC90_9SPHN